MTASWRFISATPDHDSGQWTIQFAVGLDRYSQVVVQAAAYPDGPWREVIQAAADEMINPGTTRYAPRRKYR